LRNKLTDPGVSGEAKTVIRRLLGETDDVTRMEEESIRYLLWLDSARSSSFFADVVLICEGASERVLIDYLICTKWDISKHKKICVLDSMGKYNIHRFMNLFNELGIPHSVLFDRDENQEVQIIINAFLEGQKRSYTWKMHGFDNDMETFLEIPHPPANRNDKKPLNIMWHYLNGRITEAKINELQNIVENLLTKPC